MYDKLRRILGPLEGKTVALWGLAFKPETDDVRESPALVTVRLLLEAGAAVRAYDPAAMETARRQLGGAVTYARTIYDAAEGADAIALMTEWKQFRMPSWSRLKSVMRGDLVVDGRNIFDRDEVVAAGFRYVGIGK